MRGTLTLQNKSTESEFRNQFSGVEVFYQHCPQLGERFECYGEGVEFGTRFISTSPVVEIKTTISEGALRFKTNSGSIYKLEINKENNCQQYT